MKPKKFQTAILHFGADKTGSTSIQKICDTNRKLLYKNGFYYPSGELHSIIGSCFCEKPEIYITNRLEERKDINWIKERDKQYLSNLEQELANKSGDFLVFSYEGFPDLDEDALKRFKIFLLNYADECKVLFYVREPLSYAVSAMSQRVKMGFLPYTLEYKPISGYKQSLLYCVSVFEKENVIVRLFDKKHLINNDVVEDFFSIIGLENKNIQQLSRIISDPNESLTFEALLIGTFIVKLTSSQHLTSSNFYQLFEKYLTKIKGQKIQLTLQQADVIKEATKSQTDYLRTEFGIVFPESKQKYNETNNTLISSETAESIAKILVDLAAPELAKGQNKEVISSEFQLRQAILKEGYDIVHGQALRFEVEFVLDREIAELEAGIHIWDTQKRWAFGVNSTLQKQVMYSVAPGIYRISHYVVADLPEGVYTAGFAFAEKLSDGSTKELMWYDKLCEFRVSHPSDRVGVGYANLPSTQMLTQIEPLVKNLITDGAGHIVCNTIPAQMKPSEWIDLEAEIHNDTDVTWKGDLFRPIKLSYHWLDENDNVIVFNGVRTPLSDWGILAQGSVAASMEIVAPEQDGKYKLMLTMVQESVGWFEDMEFQPFVIDIMVK